MTDPLSPALLAVKTAGEMSKGIIGADTALAKAELKIQIADLAGALADARMAIIDAQEETRTLLAKLAE